MRTLTFESCETVTQAQFAEWVEQLPPQDIHHYELLNARVVMEPPAGWPHGRVGGRLLGRLIAFVEERDLGDVMDSSQGYELPSGDTVEPDIAFVSKQRWSEAPSPVVGKFLRVVPDLVVEVMSPSTGSRDRGEKRGIYERNGVREFWLVDPRASRVQRVCLRGDRFDQGTTFTGEEALVSEILPGFRLPVGELF